MTKKTWTKAEVEAHLRNLLDIEFVAKPNISANDIKLESRYDEDLGLDSLDGVEMLMTLEEDFDCEISDAEFDTLKTVGDTVDLLMRKQGC